VTEALELGKQYLVVDNGHFTRIDSKTDHWKAIVSTDPPDGQFPPGLELDLETTYCRRTIDGADPIALTDAPNQGWDDDPAFETHGLHTYHGTTVEHEGDPYGTVCFVSEDPKAEQFRDEQTMFAELITHLLQRELAYDHYKTQFVRQSNLAKVLNRVLRHNLKNDLSVVRGRVGELTDDLQNARPAEVAIQKVDDLLALSDKARQLEGIIASDAEDRTVELRALLQELVPELQSDFPTATFTLECPPSIGVEVYPSFERAIEELLENAAKHGGEAPTVDVTVENVPNAVDIRIADDGPGLSTQETAVLEEGVETALRHGSGLGLWLVHWVVTSHEGTVEPSVTDEGTTMTVRIPRPANTGAQSAVREIERAQDQYQACFDRASDAMILIDEERRIVDANQAAARIHGLGPQELLGRKVDQFLPAGFDVERAWKEFRSRGQIRDTISVRGADGVARPVEYSARADVMPGCHLVQIRQLSDTETIEHGPTAFRSVSSS
jgi:PAS domain S-box-containing protein